MGEICFPETRNLLINQNTLSELYIDEKYNFIVFIHAHKVVPVLIGLHLIRETSFGNASWRWE